MFHKTVCVIGLGYIGLPTAAILANNGFNVRGVDNNQKIVSKINNGEIHIVEKNLAESVKFAILNNKLMAFQTV